MNQHCDVEEGDWEDEDGGEVSATFFLAGGAAGMMFSIVMFSPLGWQVFWVMPTFLKITFVGALVGMLVEAYATPLALVPKRLAIFICGAAMWFGILVAAYLYRKPEVIGMVLTG